VELSGQSLLGLVPELDLVMSWFVVLEQGPGIQMEALLLRKWVASQQGGPLVAPPVQLGIPQEESQQ
jgi:hypothetical protein